MKRGQSSLLFLDFDGVLCDSLEECFHSSAIAFYGGLRGGDPPPFGDAYRNAFRAQRPFVRDGEDYLLIHGLLSAGKSCSSQAEFDRVRRDAPPGLLEEYLELFTAARRGLIARDREAWLSLNPVYPFIAPLLPRLAADEGAYILSMKKTEFIMAILRSAGTAWATERVVSARGVSKLETASTLLEGRGAGRGFFIDDQIEHLSGGADGRIESYLALWGYVRAGARAPGVRGIRAEEGAALLGKFLERP